MKRSRSLSSRTADDRPRRSTRLLPRRSPRLQALARAIPQPTALLNLPDEALAQIYRHILLQTNDHHNTFHNLRNGFALASTCHRLHGIFFSSIHTFDATRIFPPYNSTRRSCQCRMCGHVCVSPARAIISRAAPNLRVLGIPDVLSMSILSFVADHCMFLRQISFTDDGLFTIARQSTKTALRKVLKLPQLRTLIVQDPTSALIQELAASDTKLSHVNLYGAQRPNIPQLIRFVEHGRHELESFLVSFGSLEYDVSAQMYTPHCANSIEIMNASTTTLARNVINKLLVQTTCHYLRRTPLRCLYVTTHDDDLRFGRCDNARQRPRHCLVRTAMRPRCTGFHYSTPHMSDMDVQRPACHAAIFDAIDISRHHSNSMTKFIEPPLPDENFYCLWHNPCATLRLDSRFQKRAQNGLLGSSCGMQNGNKNLSNNGSATALVSSSLSPSSSSNSPERRLIGRVPKTVVTREGNQASEVVCTKLRKLALQGCECDLWRFDSLPNLHALEISPMCTTVLRSAKLRERTLRIVQRAVMTLRRVHVNWFYGACATDYGFEIVTQVIERAKELTMLDFSMSFVVMAIENRKMVSMFTHACNLKVLHIGCCSHLTSSAIWFPSSEVSATGEAEPEPDSTSESVATGTAPTTTNPSREAAEIASAQSFPSRIAAAATECHSNICLSRFVAVLPRLLKMISRWCDHICRIDLHVENHWIDMGREVDAQQFGKICRWALIALTEFQNSMPKVDVCSLQSQLNRWSREAAYRNRPSVPKILSC